MIANLENRAFILILLVVTGGFFWLLAPFYSAIFWAAILAILFSPTEKRLQHKLHGRSTLSALLTTLGIMLLVVIPLVLVLILLGVEAVDAYKSLTRGDFSIQPYLDGIQQTFPFLENWISKWDENLASMKSSLSKTALNSERIASRRPGGTCAHLETATPAPQEWDISGQIFLKLIIYSG